MAVISVMPEITDSSQQEPTTKKRATWPLAVRLEVKRTFIHGGATLAQLSKDRGIPYNTIVGWSMDERWIEQRTKWVAAQEAKLSEESEPSTKPAEQRSEIG